MNNVHKGFTLIELLVVIAIVGVLSSVVVQVTSPARSRARDARRKQDINQIVKAVSFYYSTNGTNPGPSCTTIYSSNAFRNAITPTYMASLPSDPTLASQTGDYLYRSINANNGQYNVCAIMENTSNSNGSFNYSSPPCSATTYNYCVSQ